VIDLSSCVLSPKAAAGAAVVCDDPGYAAYKTFRAKCPRAVLTGLGAALEASAVTALDGLPYPVKFRNQGAFEAWERALSCSQFGRQIWRYWAKDVSTCRECLHEIHLQLEQHGVSGPRRCSPMETANDLRANAIQFAANIHYERRRGALIETTRALDTLLRHSDLDESLQMRFFAPPFSTQYLRLDRDLVDEFLNADDRANFRWIDGVFCFLTTEPAPDEQHTTSTMLELVVVYNNNDQGIGTKMLCARIGSPEQSVTGWVNSIFLAQNGRRNEGDEAMCKLINFMAKVFLYLGLKDARKEMNADYSAAIKRLEGLGPKKKAKLHHRLQTMYDRITVGPESLPSPPAAEHDSAPMSPHWRRGHFRLQPCGPAHGCRKLIFVAPILIRADRLNGQAPRTKSYEVATCGSKREPGRPAFPGRPG
jgi:hypothetical protein